MTTHPDAFPWLQHLDTDDRTHLVNDLREALTGTSGDALRNLNQTVHEWANTALVLADPELRAALTNKELPGDSR